MNAQVDVVVNLSMLSRIVAERIGRDRIPAATLTRWRLAALIPSDKREFDQRDVEKLVFIGKYLDADRSLERAEQALIKYLEQQ